MRGDQNSSKYFFFKLDKIKKKTWEVFQLDVAFLERILTFSH